MNQPIKKIFLLLTLVFFHRCAFAQFNSSSSGNWNSTSTWNTGVVPSTGATVIINTGHNVTIDISSVNLSGITVNSGGTLTLFASGTLGISGTLMVNGTLNMSSSTVTVASGGSLIKNAGGIINYGSSNVIASGNANLTGFTFYNLQAAGTLTLSGTNSIFGFLKLNSGASVSGGLFTYQPGSRLIYNQGIALNTGNEWKDNISSGPGVPRQVTISSGTSLTFTNGSQYRYILGGININGSLTLSNSTQGHLELEGDFIVGNTGVFSYNGRKVVFKGSSTQTIQRIGGGEVEFCSIFLAGSGGITQSASPNATQVKLTGANSKFIVWSGAGNYNLNGQVLNVFSSAAGNIDLSGGGTKLMKSDLSGGTCKVSGTNTVTIAQSGSSAIKFDDDVTVQLEGTLNFGSSISTVNGILLMKDGGSVSTNSPFYGINSQLVYGTSASVTRGNEWAQGAGTAGTAGYPQGEVVVNTGSVSFSGTTSALTCGKKLTIKSGASLTMANMSGLLKTGGISVQGSFSLSTNAAGNLEVNAGDFHMGAGASFSTNNRRVFITGPGNQSFLSSGGAINLTFLTVNKSGGTLYLQTPLLLSGASGDVLQFLNATLIDIGNNKLSISGTSGNISLGTFASKITGTGSGVVELGGGSYAVTGTGSLTFDGSAGLTTNTSTAGTLNLGAGLIVIKSFLQVSHPSYVFSGSVTYDTGSSLIYDCSATPRAAGAEWNYTGVGGSKPWNVLLKGSSVLNLTSSQTYAVSSTFTMNTGTVLNAFKLSVSGDVVINTGATCALSSTDGLQCSGSQTQNISILPSFLSGNGVISINKMGGLVKLLNPLTCKKLLFISGNTADVDLNGSNNLTFPLNTSGIMGEGTAGRVLNSVNAPSGTGFISAQANFANNINPGNLGLTFTGSSSSLITVKRYMRPVTGFGGNPSGSLMRMFEVTAAPGTNLAVSYLFLDAELNSIDAVNQQLFLFASSNQTSGFLMSPDPANQLYDYTARKINTTSPYAFSSSSLFITATAQYVTPVITTIQNGSWNDPATWQGGNIPSNIQANVIINHNVNLSVALGSANAIQDLTITTGKSLTLASGSSLYVGGTIANSGAFTLNSNSRLFLLPDASFANSGTFASQGVSTLTCNGNANLQNLGSVSCLEIKGSVSCSNSITINDSLKLFAGGSLSGSAPLYGTSSVLVYNQGTNVQPGLEWSSISNAGYPIAVRIQNGTLVSFSASGNKGIGGKLRIETGSGLNMNPSSGTYTDTLLIHGNLVLAGTLTLPASGGGLALINGGMSLLPGSIFIKGKGIVSFRGNADQVIEAVTGDFLEFYAMEVNKSSGSVTLGASDLLLSGDNGYPLLTLHKSSVLDLNGKNLFFQTSSSAVISAGSGTGLPSLINSNTSESSVNLPSGDLLFTGSGTRKIQSGTNVSWNTGTQISTLDFGNPVRLNIGGSLVKNSLSVLVTNPPEYAATSTLVYAGHGCSAGNEWRTNVSSGAGVPYQVVVSDSTQMNHIGYRKVLGNITVNNDTLYLASGDLQVEGNLTANSGYIQGDITNNVIFNGSANAWISVPELPGLVIAKTGGAIVRLSDNLRVLRNLTMTGGSLDLNGAKTLSVAGSIVNETPLNRIYNSVPGFTGYISHFENVNTSVNTTLGNLGMELNNINGSCLVEVRRYPSTSLMITAGNPSMQSIFRFKSFGDIDGNISIRYAPFNLSGNTAGNLRWWSSTTGAANTYYMEPATDDFATVQRLSNALPDNSEKFFTLGAGPLSSQVYRSVGNGNFESALTWDLNATPQPGARYIIMPGHTVSVNLNHTSSETYSSLFVYAGATLQVNANKNIFLADSLNNNGNFVLQSNAALVLTGQTNLINNSPDGFSNGLGTINAVGTVIVSGTNAIKAGSLSVSSGILDLQQSIEVSDSLKILANGSLSGIVSPVYRQGSTLVYASGGLHHRGIEWISDGAGVNYPTAIPEGYPYNLRIYNQTQLNVGGISPGAALAINNTLTVEQGSIFDCNYNGSERTGYTYSKNIRLNNGMLYMAPEAQGRLVLLDGDIYSADFTNLVCTGANTEFEFRSTTSQQRMDGKFSFASGKWILNNSFADIGSVASQVLIKPSCNINFLTTKGFDGAFDFEFSGSGRQISLTGGNRNFALNGGNITFLPGASYTFSGTGTLTVDANQLNVQAAPVTIGNGLLVLGNTTTMNIFPAGGISGYPVYAGTSTLCYKGQNNFTTGTEWQTGSGPGSPYHVTISMGANLSIPAGYFYVRGNFTADNTGNNLLNLQAATQLFVKGNFHLNICQFMPNGGKVIFNGTSDQQVLVANPFYSLEINNTAGDVVLLQDVSIDGNLTFVSGNLNLNGKILTLGTDAQIMNETSLAAVIDPTSQGKITTTRNFTTNNINSSNNGNIGIEIYNSPTPLGVVTLERYIRFVSGVGVNASINRIYSVWPPQAYNAQVRVRYLTTELNGNTNDNTMRIYFSQSMFPGGSYVPVSQVTSLYSGNNLSNSLTSVNNEAFPPSATYFSVANQDPPFTGVLNFPSVNFPDVNSLISTINSSGIGAGGLTVNIASGVDTIYLNNPIVIDIANNGPNQDNPLVISGDPLNPPTIRAYRGGTLDRDALVYVIGNDFITMQNINLYDPPVNDDNYERMEWGVAILKRNSSNACQSLLLRNWNIRLQVEDTVSTGIYIGNHSFDPTQTFTISSTSGCHSSIVLQRNNILRVNKGIMLRGYNDPSGTFFDRNILIGDSVNASNGNQIQAFGGVNYKAYGIRCMNASGIFVHNNTIRNAAANGLPAIDEIRGISLEGNSRGYLSVSKNRISISQGATGESMYGIFVGLNNSGISRIQNNRLTQFSNSAGTANVYGINITGTPAGRLLLRNNAFTACPSLLSSGNVYGLYNETAARVYIENDTISEITSASNQNVMAIYNQSSADSILVTNNLIQNISKTGASGQFFGYFNESPVMQLQMLTNALGGQGLMMAPAGVENISFNIIKGIGVLGATNLTAIRTTGRAGMNKITNVNVMRSLSAATGTIEGIAVNNGLTILSNDNALTTVNGQGTIYGFSSNQGGTLTFSNDSVYQVTQNGNGNVYGIFHGSTGTGTSTKTMTLNTISTINKIGSGTGAVYGIYHNTNGTGGHGLTVNQNIITNLQSSGNDGVFGIFHNTNGTGGVHTISSNNNSIQQINGSGTGTPVYGIYHNTNGTGGSNNWESSSNLISNISNNGSGNVYGIFHNTNGTGGSQLRQSNNISAISSGGSGNVYGIFHNTNGTGGSSLLSRSYQNNIHDIDNGTGTGSVYGIYHNTNGTGGGYPRSRMYSNTINNLKAASDSTIGIFSSGFDSVQIRNNRLSKLKTTNGYVTGMEVDASMSGGMVSNNLIGDFSTVSSNAAQALSSIITSGSSSNALRFYYNTIHLQATSSGAGFGSNIFMLDGNAPVVMKNNLFVNQSAASSGGGVRVIRSTAPLSAAYFASWDNNAYFVSDSTASGNFIYSDGVNNVPGIAAYRSFTGAESNSFSEPVAFLSTSGSSSDFLKPDLTVATRIESGGSVSNQGISTDYAGNLRFGATGYAGSGTATDVGAYENNYITSLHQWLGVISSDWSAAGNWTANVLPTSTMDIVIPAGTTFAPSVISAGVSCQSIQLKTLAGNNPTVSINGAHVLSMLGNLSGNGTFSGTGTLVCDAAAGQTLTGALTFGNLKINNTSPSASTTINTGSDVRVRDILTLQAGTLVTGNALTLKSTALKMAMISGNGTGTILGNVTVERYVSGVRGYHYLGSPVNNALQSQWSDDFLIYGDDNYSYDPNNFTNQFGSCWSYDETAAQPDPMYGWISHVNPAYPLTSGKGLVAVVPSGTVISVQGPVNHGSFTSSFLVSRTNSTNATADGFNLIANPYPSPISWNALRALPGQVDMNAAYFSWIPNDLYSGNYGYFNGVVGTMGVGDQIALGQGFFVSKTTTGASPFIANNSVRMNSTSPQFFSDEAPEGLIKLSFGSAHVEDECIIYQNADALEGFDSGMDAEKVSHPIFTSSQLYSLDASGKEYAIQVIPRIENEMKVIPLNVVAEHSGRYTFTAQELISDGTHEVYFEDRLLGNISLLQKGDRREVQLSEGLSSGRFFIHYSATAISNNNASALPLQLYASGKNLYLNLPESHSNARIRMINPLGQLVREFTFDGSKGLHTFNESELGGAFVVQFVSDKGSMAEKVMLR